MNAKNILLIVSFVSCSFATEVFDDDDEDYYGSPKRYNGYSILNIIPDTEEKLNFIRSLEYNNELDFWTIPAMVNNSVDVMVPPDILQEIQEKLSDKEIDFAQRIENVQKLIDEENQYLHNNESASFHKESLSSFFRKYHKSKHIYQYLNQLKHYINNSLIEIEDIGTTYHKKVLKLVKIRTNSKETKPIVWIDGGIHGNERIASATALYFIYKLLRGYQFDEEITHLLNTYDWYIMPLVNPDGYDYTFIKDRFWRKNRSKGISHKEGVDLNRNFRYGWNNYLTKYEDTNPSSSKFIGPFTISEEETQAIYRILEKVKRRVRLFLTLHSYGQYITFPWGCKTESVEEYNLMKEIGESAAKAIESYSGTKYQTGSIFELMNALSGNSVDWVYGELDIQYAFAFELREKSFSLNPSEIIPTGEETWLGVCSILDIIRTAD